MAEENINQEQQAQTPVDPTIEGNGKDNEVISKAEFESEKKRMTELMEQIKKSQKGVDKRNQELERENQELKKAQMSDKERAEYEKKLFEQEKINLQNEKTRLEQENMISEYFAKNKIDYEYRRHVYADSPEALVTELEHLKSLIAKERKEERESFRANETGKPVSGNEKLGTVGEDMFKLSSSDFDKQVLQKIKDPAERERVENTYLLKRREYNQMR